MRKNESKGHNIYYNSRAENTFERIEKVDRNKTGKKNDHAAMMYRERNQNQDVLLSATKGVGTIR